MTRVIPATLGFEAIVDDEDYAVLARYRWYAHNGDGSKRPARRTSVSEGRKVVFLVHHIIKPAPGLVVDHIDGNPWNNTRGNLRVCTHAENLKNQHRKPRGDLLKGVNRRGNRFVATISSDSVFYQLGSYDTVADAALAYDAAALFLHGEFACLNFPDAGTAARRPQDIRGSWARVPNAVAKGANLAAEVIRLMRDGHNAKVAAAAVGVTHRRAWLWARAAGVEMKRGRPLKHTRSPAPVEASGVAA